jgi:hypothetical protein
MDYEFFFSLFGTGSCPQPPQGLQDAIRLAAIQPPLRTPHSLIASMEYWEQVGVYLQLAGKIGLIIH